MFHRICFFSLWVCFLSWGQKPILLADAGLRYENEAQLEKIYREKQQSLVVIEGAIFYVPCGCSPCRNMGAGAEGRNQGGDTAGRNLGGDASRRNQGGDTAGRNLGGDASGRNQGGDTAGRNLGGEASGRNQGGDTAGRNLGGEASGRNQGGDTAGRNLGGEASGRNQGGDTAGRNLGGNSYNFACQKVEEGFQLMNMNFNGTILYYDGIELKTLKNKKGIVEN